MSGNLILDYLCKDRTFSLTISEDHILIYGSRGYEDFSIYHYDRSSKKFIKEYKNSFEFSKPPSCYYAQTLSQYDFLHCRESFSNNSIRVHPDEILINEFKTAMVINENTLYVELKKDPKLARLYQTVFYEKLDQDISSLPKYFLINKKGELIKEEVQVFLEDNHELGIAFNRLNNNQVNTHLVNRKNDVVYDISRFDNFQVVSNHEHILNVIFRKQNSKVEKQVYANLKNSNIDSLMINEHPTFFVPPNYYTNYGSFSSSKIKQIFYGNKEIVLEINEDERILRVFSIKINDELHIVAVKSKGFNIYDNDGKLIYKSKLEYYLQRAHNNILFINEGNNKIMLNEKFEPTMLDKYKLIKGKNLCDFYVDDSKYLLAISDTESQILDGKSHEVLVSFSSDNSRVENQSKSNYGVNVNDELFIMTINGKSGLLRIK